MSPLPLLPSEAHIWYAFTDAVTEPGLLAEYQAMLGADERARHQRFHFEHSRHQFLVSHALVRIVLSQYVDVPPAAWWFAAGRFGKPEVAGPRDRPLRFNLSHTDGLAAVAVTRLHEIGVDVENIERRTAGLELAQRFFAPAEVDQLRAMDEVKRQETFFEFWTLKEAHIKARGLGLTLPLDSFAFHLMAGRPPRISFTAQADDPAVWQFVQLTPAPRLRLALAIRRPGCPDLTVTARCVGNRTAAPITADAGP